MRQYGKPPIDLGHVPLKNDGEMMCYVYLPVRMPFNSGYRQGLKLPPNLAFMKPLLFKVMIDAAILHGGNEYLNSYVYATVKRLFVTQGSPGNRPGWHADGYGSDGDINYVWYDMNPTLFCEQEFHDVPDDDALSMKAFEQQSEFRNWKTYPNEHLLRLDEDVVHCVHPSPQTGVRTFIKISVSKHRYNLRGNSHNYLFDYDWPMHDREILRRNCDNKDFVK